MADERLAKHVVSSHVRSHPHAEHEDEAAAVEMRDLFADETVPLSRLAASSIKSCFKSIRIKHLKPSLNNIDQDKVAKLYADLRRESTNNGGVPIAVRHIESIMHV